jgi:hypothetical protein
MISGTTTAPITVSATVSISNAGQTTVLAS